MKSLRLIISLILTVGYLTSVQAVTDAELEALEKQIEQQEAEEKKQVEDVKKKAEAKQKMEAEIIRKAEQKRNIEAEINRKVEERLKTAEKLKDEEEAKSKAEEERLKKEAKEKARAEAEQAKQVLHESLVGLWKLTLRCSWGGDTYPLVLTILDANGEFSLKGAFGIYNFKEGRINNDSISYIYHSNEEHFMNFSGKLISKTRMEGTYTTTSNNDVCNWDLIR